MDVKNALNMLIQDRVMDSDVKLQLTLEGSATSYDISEFFVDFSQEVDHRGQPLHETNGGFIRFSITEIPDNTLNKWMFEADKKMAGEFNFKKKSMSSPLKISFSDAYCINYQKNIGMGNVHVRIDILPGMISVNGKTHTTRWGK